MDGFWKLSSNNISCFHLVSIYETHLHFTNEETEAQRNLEIISAYMLASSKDKSWMPPRTSFEAISLSVALCTIKKMCFRKILNVPSCSLKSHVNQRSGWDKCQAALWFYFSRFLAVPVPADFSITLSRLGIKSKSVSQTVFYKNKYLWFS